MAAPSTRNSKPQPLSPVNNFNKIVDGITQNSLTKLTRLYTSSVQALTKLFPDRQVTISRLWPCLGLGSS